MKFKVLKAGLVSSTLVVCSLVNTANAGLITYTFTNAEQTGRLGPSQSQIDTAYNGGMLDGSVSVFDGIQSWSVQHTGVYTITAYGAEGAKGYAENFSSSSLGGYGAVMKGDFALSSGDILKILVGQMGSEEKNYLHRSGGGGGGTYVTSDVNTPLIIAGGGGGGGNLTRGQTNGDAGQSGTDGTQNGGSSGSGGSVNSYGGAGGGLFGDGAVNAPSNIFSAESFTNGGDGGYANEWAQTAVGGFGGGGAAALLGGGGGGYSGGGSSGYWAGSGTAGGGGSFNDGFNQLNGSGLNSGNGFVVISFNDDQLLSPTAVPEPSTLAVLALGLMGLASRRFKTQS
jgi:hypothetical protein